MNQLEQEIKLNVQTDAPLDLMALPWLAQFNPADACLEHLVSTYYDTPTNELLKYGAGLRLRCVGGQWFQTVKCSGEVVDGLHRRQEWEQALEQPVFNLEKLQQTALAELIVDMDLWQRVEPVFTTDFMRHSWQLTLPQQTQVELAYDRGKVIAGDKTWPIHEIELELKSGSVDEMKQLAEQFFNTLAVTYSDTSKAERGYRLVRNSEDK